MVALFTYHADENIFDCALLVVLTVVCFVVSWQLSELQPVLSLMNSSYGDSLTRFENGTQQSGSLDSAAVLRAAGMLFCQRELRLNETNDREQYFDKFRPNQQTSLKNVDNSSFTYVYDNSTSESSCHACRPLSVYEVWSDRHIVLCLRFGLWLTLCTLNIDIDLLTNGYLPSYLAHQLEP